MILVLVVIGIALSRGIEQAEVGVLAAPKDDRTRRILVLGLLWPAAAVALRASATASSSRHH